MIPNRTNVNPAGIAGRVLLHKGINMIHEMRLKARPFEQIATGCKTVELRLNDPKRQKIAVGDAILFQRMDDMNQVLAVQVVALHTFASFGELYKAIPLDKCGYSPAELSDASPEDMLQYYTTEEEGKWSVLAIEIEVKCLSAQWGLNN